MLVGTLFSALGWLIVESSLRALLIGTVAGLVLLALRNRNVHLAHRVWVSVVFGMLALPILSATLPGLAILPGGWFANASRAAALSPTGGDSIAPSKTKLSKPDSSLGISAVSVSAEGKRSQVTDSLVNNLRTSEATDKQSIRLANPGSIYLGDSTAPSSFLFGVFWWLGLAWFAGFALLLIYRALGIFQLWRLLASASRIENLSPLPPCTIVSETDLIRSPVLVGLFRHQILFPSGWRHWSAEKIRAVIAHETAHIERADGLVGGIADLATMLYWFHPLAWLAATRLKQQAELCCDEAAALKMGDRLGYAQQLVEIATLNFLAPNRQPGIAMARCSEISTRVGVLIDSSHRLRSSISFRATLLLSAAICPAILAAATLQPADEQDPELKAGRLELEIVGPDGEPIPFAKIEFYTDNPNLASEQIEIGSITHISDWQADCRADKKGRFVLRYPENSEYRLKIHQHQHVPYLIHWQNGSPLPSQRIVLDKGATWGGTVVDETGKPITNAEVRFAFETKQSSLQEGSSEPPSTVETVKTDQDGKWTFEGIPAHLDSLKVLIRHSEFAHLISDIKRLSSIQLVMSKGLSISGQVVDEQDQPIAGALVQTYDYGLQQATTDQDGRYLITGCHQRAARITVSARGKATDMKLVEVAPDLQPVNFKMEKGGRVRVRLIDKNDRPVSDAHVYVQRWREAIPHHEFDHAPKKTNENGIWEWLEAPKDEFVIEVANPNITGASQSLRAREEEYVIRVSPPVEIIGKVIDFESRKPIEEFQVIPGQDPGSLLSWLVHERFRARNGAFRLKRNSSYSLEHRVKVQADGYQPVESRKIKRNEGRVELLFEMKPVKDDLSFGLKIMTPDGKPAAGAKAALGVDGTQIFIKHGKMAPLLAEQFETSAAGRLHIPNQKEDYQLIIVHETGFAVVLGESLPEEDTIRLTKWAQAEGVFKVAGKPVPGVALQMVSPIGSSNRGLIMTNTDTATDAKGRYRFERVFPGPGTIFRHIEVIGGKGASEITSSTQVRARFEPGKTTFVDFGEEGVAVTGRLLPPVNYQGDPVWRFAMVKLFPKELWSQEPRYSATVDRGGTFRFEDVEPANYLLSVDFFEQSVGFVKDIPVRIDPDAESQSADVVDLGEIRLNKSPPQN